MHNILIVNNAEPEFVEFTGNITDILNRYKISLKIIQYRECLNTDFKTFSGIILSGSPQGDDIVDHHLPWFQWLKTIEVPVLGICAGHHITGALYNSQLLRSQEPESGDFEVEIVEQDDIFNGMPDKFKVRQMHNDSITLPEEFKLLATSITCKNQLMKHKEKPLYTCQFHPEFYNHDLILNFVEICKRSTDS